MAELLLGVCERLVWRLLVRRLRMLVLVWQLLMLELVRLVLVLERLVLELERRLVVLGRRLVGCGLRGGARRARGRGEGRGGGLTALGGGGLAPGELDTADVCIPFGRGLEGAGGGVGLEGRIDRREDGHDAGHGTAA